MNKKTLRIVVLALMAVVVSGYHYIQNLNQGVDAGDDRGASHATLKAPKRSQLPSFLPKEAHDTLKRIANDGPFKYSQDGGTFGNYEGHLPKKSRGYYHEYTVETPGADDRGARRIITGGNPPTVYYYTDDHYHSFRQFKLDQ